MGASVFPRLTVIGSWYLDSTHVGIEALRLIQSIPTAIIISIYVYLYFIAYLCVFLN